MAILISEEDGLEVITLVPERVENFVPLLGTANTTNVQFIWQSLPDDLQELQAGDRRYIEQIWTAMFQYAAGVLAEISHLDQTSSLIDFPVHLPRKWMMLELENRVDLRSFASQLIDETRNSRGSRAFFGGAGADEATYLEVTHGARHEGLAVPLRGPHSQRATTRAEFRFNFSSLASPEATFLRVEEDLGPPADGPEAWILFGYGDLNRERLAAGVYAAVSTAGRLAAVHRTESGSMSWTNAAGAVDAVSEGQDVVLSMWYAGATEDDPGRLTVQLETTDGASVIQTQVDVDSRFLARQMVIVAADTRPPIEAPNTAILEDGRGRTVALLLDELTYLDVALDQRVRHIPALQPRITDDSDLLLHELDFRIEVSETRARERSTLLFVDQPAAVLWAEWVSLDNRLLEKIYGQFVGTTLSNKGPDTEKFKNKLVGLLYGLVAGPYPGPLRVALAAMAGVPVALESGRVLSTVGPNGEHAITIRGFDGDRSYAYPPELRPTVAVGDEVRKLEILTEHPTILDWKDGGQSFASRISIENEVQKFSSVLVEIPAGSDGTARADSDRPDNFVNQAREYLDLVLPLWVGVFRLFFVLIFRVEEEFDLTDALSFDAELTLHDALTNALDARYNDVRQFRYDESGLIYDEAYVNVLKDQLEVEATNTGGAPLAVSIFGDPYVIGVGATITVEEDVD